MGMTSKPIKRILLLGLITNLLLSGLKFFLGLTAHSQALVADAVHSLSDITTDIAVLSGAYAWSKPPDEEHPYGHGRIETLVTLAISLILFAVAFGVGYRALSMFKEMQTVQPRWIACIGAVLSIGIKEWLYRVTMRIGTQEKSPATIANAWHHRADALSSIPVAVAIAAAAFNPGLAFLDGIGAFVVALVIMHAAWQIMWPAIEEILGTGISPELLLRIEEFSLCVLHTISARVNGEQGGMLICMCMSHQR